MTFKDDIFRTRGCSYSVAENVSTQGAQQEENEVNHQDPVNLEAPILRQMFTISDTCDYLATKLMESLARMNIARTLWMNHMHCALREECLTIVIAKNGERHTDNLRELLPEVSRKN